MTEQNPEGPVADDTLADAPKDVPQDEATGYAIYNRTLGQYVPGVHPDRPTASAITKALPKGHRGSAVRV